MSAEERWGTDVQRTHCREGEARQNVLFEGHTASSRKELTVLNKLKWIAQKARRHPEMSFNNVMCLIDLGFLLEAYRRVNKKAKAGVDGVTYEDYSVNLYENLENLLARMKAGSYRAPPVKRIYIEKEDGKKRPLGLPAFEDKIVQMSVSMILTAVYDIDFYNFSHGFRKNHNAHQALGEFRDACGLINVRMVVDADVSGFFDNIDHRLLIEHIKKRVNDVNLI